MEPFTAAIYAGDAHQMGLRPLFSTLAEWEEKRGSLTAGIRAARAKARGSPKGHVFCTFRDGMGSLTLAIAAKLRRFSVQTGASVTSLALTGDRNQPPFHLAVQGRASIKADCVVLAVPAPDAAALVRPAAPQIARLLEGLTFVATASVHLAFRRRAVAHPLNGTGFLVPRTEPSPITGCTWASSKWPGRAPPDWVLLRAFTGWASDDSFMDKDDSALVRLATEALRPLLGLSGQPDRAWVHRWPSAMPQYGVGHVDWLSGLDSAVAGYPGLFLAGASYSGIGVPDCIRQAKEAAQRVRQFLSQPPAILVGSGLQGPLERS
jgi:oxygen-dependent protoporphyrinogen oxidase